jgi:hypothetical protein
MAMIIVAAACQRNHESVAIPEVSPSPQTGTQNAGGLINSQTGGQTGVTPTPTPTLIPDVSIPCRDTSGKTIAGQFTNQALNQVSQPVDCYDESGKLVYQGTKKSSCYDDLTARFGVDILFPTQQLFPKLYDQAQQQGANGEKFLHDALQNSSCAELKAKEG